MQELTKFHALQELSLLNKKFYLYASGWDLEEYSYTEIFQCFPALEGLYNVGSLAIYEDYTILEFNSLDEMNDVYKSIVGDDNSHANNYFGNLRIYAMTIYNGQIQNENT